MNFTSWFATFSVFLLRLQLDPAPEAGPQCHKFGLCFSLFELPECPEVGGMNSLHRFGLAIIGCLVLSNVVLAQPEPDAVIPEVHLTFTTVDVPGAVISNVTGINSAGDMVGYYTATSNGPGTGFLLTGGDFSFFSYPGADSTLAFGINDSALVSGTAYTHEFTAANGFLYDGANFVSVRAPGQSATFSRGINNAKTVVGAAGSLSFTDGFELSGQRFVDISPPGSYIFVFATGINNLGQIVGTTDDQAFLYSGNKFKHIRLPWPNNVTTAMGINDDGFIVGSYEKCFPCAFYGFVRHNGKYLSFGYPGAMETDAFGISNNGEIVGSYTFDQQTYHGFVTSPITAADFVK
jgi:probable HAF family extracellular repeat protein